MQNAQPSEKIDKIVKSDRRHIKTPVVLMCQKNSGSSKIALMPS